MASTSATATENTSSSANVDSWIVAKNGPDSPHTRTTQKLADKKQSTAPRSTPVPGGSSVSQIPKFQTIPGLSLNPSNSGSPAGGNGVRSDSGAGSRQGDRQQGATPSSQLGVPELHTSGPSTSTGKSNYAILVPASVQIRGKEVMQWDLKIDQKTLAAAETLSRQVRDLAAQRDANVNGNAVEPSGASSACPANSASQTVVGSDIHSGAATNGPSHTAARNGPSSAGATPSGIGTSSNVRGNSLAPTGNNGLTIRPSASTSILPSTEGSPTGSKSSSAVNSGIVISVTSSSFTVMSSADNVRVSSIGSTASTTTPLTTAVTSRPFVRNRLHPSPPPVSQSPEEDLPPLSLSENMLRKTGGRNPREMLAEKLKKASGARGAGMGGTNSRGRLVASLAASRLQMSGQQKASDDSPSPLNSTTSSAAPAFSGGSRTYSSPTMGYDSSYSSSPTFQSGPLEHPTASLKSKRLASPSPRSTPTSTALTASGASRRNSSPMTSQSEHLLGSFGSAVSSNKTSTCLNHPPPSATQLPSTSASDAGLSTDKREHPVNFGASDKLSASGNHQGNAAPLREHDPRTLSTGMRNLPVLDGDLITNSVVGVTETAASPLGSSGNRNDLSDLDELLKYSSPTTSAALNPFPLRENFGSSSSLSQLEVLDPIPSGVPSSGSKPPTVSKNTSPKGRMVSKAEKSNSSKSSTAKPPPPFPSHNTDISGSVASRTASGAPNSASTLLQSLPTLPAGVVGAASANGSVASNTLTKPPSAAAIDAAAKLAAAAASGKSLTGCGTISKKERKAKGPAPFCEFCGAPPENKACRQRSIVGFNFCIRHILHDPSAPYRMCAYVRKQGSKEIQCSNAVHVDRPTEYCTTHLIALGVVEPKRKPGSIANQKKKEETKSQAAAVEAATANSTQGEAEQSGPRSEGAVPSSPQLSTAPSTPSTPQTPHPHGPNTHPPSWSQPPSNFGANPSSPRGPLAQPGVPYGFSPSHEQPQPNGYQRGYEGSPFPHHHPAGRGTSHQPGPGPFSVASQATGPSRVQSHHQPNGPTGEPSGLPPNVPPGNAAYIPNSQPQNLFTHPHPQGQFTNAGYGHVPPPSYNAHSGKTHTNTHQQGQGINHPPQGAPHGLLHQGPRGPLRGLPPGGHPSSPSPKNQNQGCHNQPPPRGGIQQLQTGLQPGSSPGGYFHSSQMSNGYPSPVHQQPTNNNQQVQMSPFPPPSPVGQGGFVYPTVSSVEMGRNSTPRPLSNLSSQGLPPPSPRSWLPKTPQSAFPSSEVIKSHPELSSKLLASNLPHPPLSLGSELVENGTNLGNRTLSQSSSLLDDSSQGPFLIQENNPYLDSTIPTASVGSVSRTSLVPDHHQQQQQQQQRPADFNNIPPGQNMSNSRLPPGCATVGPTGMDNFTGGNFTMKTNLTGLLNTTANNGVPGAPNVIQTGAPIPLTSRGVPPIMFPSPVPSDQSIESQLSSGTTLGGNSGCFSPPAGNNVFASAASLLPPLIPFTQSSTGPSPVTPHPPHASQQQQQHAGFHPSPASGTNTDGAYMGPRGPVVPSGMGPPQSHLDKGPFPPSQSQHAPGPMPRPAMPHGSLTSGGFDRNPLGIPRGKMLLSSTITASGHPFIGRTLSSSHDDRGHGVVTSANNNGKKVIRLKQKKRRAKMSGKYRRIPEVDYMCKIAELDFDFDRLDLFPLGLEPSSSDTEGEDDTKTTTDADRCFVSRLLGSLDEDVEDGEGLAGLEDLDEIFPEGCLDGGLTAKHELYLLKKQLRLERGRLRKSWQEGVAVVGTSKHYPNAVGKALWDRVKKSKVKLKKPKAPNDVLHPTLERTGVSTQTSVDRAELKRQCYHRTTEGRRCPLYCLAYSNHCLNHILYNVDQRLFRYCAEPGCQNPVLDLGMDSHLPCGAHCSLHSRQKVDQLLLADGQPSSSTRPGSGSTITANFDLTPGGRKRKHPKQYNFLRKRKRRRTVTVGRQGLNNSSTLASALDSSESAGLEDEKEVLNPDGTRTSTPLDELEEEDDAISSLSRSSSMDQLSTEDVGSVGPDVSGSRIPVDNEVSLASVAKDLGFEDHELADMLNKLPEEAFSSILTQDDFGRNGDSGIRVEEPSAVIDALVIGSGGPSGSGMPVGLLCSGGPSGSGMSVGLRMPMPLGPSVIAGVVAASVSGGAPHSDAGELIPVTEGSHSWADVESFLLSEGYRGSSFGDLAGLPHQQSGPGGSGTAGPGGPHSGSATPGLGLPAVSVPVTGTGAPSAGSISGHPGPGGVMGGFLPPLPPPPPPYPSTTGPPPSPHITPPASVPPPGTPSSPWHPPPSSSR